MMNPLPKVIPINELKNTAQISKTCKESNVPIVITKNGYADMVIMSVELYEETIAKMKAALLINESLAEVQNGGKPIVEDTFFSEIRKKYGK